MLAAIRISDFWKDHFGIMSKSPLINRKPIEVTFSLSCGRNTAGECSLWLRSLQQLTTLKLCQGASGRGFLDRSGLDVYKTDFLLLLHRNIRSLRNVPCEQTGACTGLMTGHVTIMQNHKNIYPSICDQCLKCCNTFCSRRGFSML